jgi:PAS domain S-box-containing protein
VASWNPGAARMMGYAAHEIIGQPFASFYAPQDCEARLPEKALEIARRESRFADEGWRQRKDGSRFWADLALDALRDEAGALIGFSQLTRDLTERREKAPRLGGSQQSQQMEAVAQLTAGIAHDFNNLLTGIMGSLDLIKMRLAQGRLQDLERYLLAAQGEAARAATLTQRLQAFSRQALEPKADNADKRLFSQENL